ncbi:MAG: hypothetical protein M3394_10080 [Actinomycetota bacterium]|nr:hypothetical protein [Actinomycetota bacterium]
MAGLPACQAGHCTSTTMEATPAVKVSLSRGGVLDARLTSEGAPLPGKTIEFAVLDDDATVYRGEAGSDGDGRARDDLKQVDPNALTGLARADGWRASFDGDATYCSSVDDAPFSLLQE